MKFKYWLNENNIPKPYNKWGVGKLIGGKVYIHKNYENNIPSKYLIPAKNVLPKDFNYNLLSYNLKDNSITFTLSPDFDSSDEPIVSTQYLVKSDLTLKLIKPHLDPWIYHHKYLWVKPDYKGFNYEQSKERSKYWLSKDDIDKSKIGKLSYWKNLKI